MNRTPQYWIIKTTTSGNEDERQDYWKKFYDEQVVAIGWPDIPVSPEGMSVSEIREHVIKWYSCLGKERRFNYSARTINKFANVWRAGDLAIISRGWNQDQPHVHLLGFAIVDDFHHRPQSGWWTFQRDAKIRGIDQDIEREVFVRTLGLKTAMQAIHSITATKFHKFSAEIQALFPQLWSGVTTGYPVRFRT
ncbi:MAG: hypothetical protein KKB13_01520 [Chloroflexi bacterium]|nr:hypothetical protein [Chloroflexota bacterium]